MYINLLILSCLASLASSAAILPRRSIPSLDVTLPARTPKASPIAPNASSCVLASATMPVAATPLPPPSEGLYLYHVAIGRGTQNYTCASTPSATPVAIGALATLYNASCIASNYSTVLPTLSTKALKTALTLLDGSTPMKLDTSGHHYFANTTTPSFNMDTSTTGQLGLTHARKVATSAAPSTADKGQFGAVPWLKLESETGATEGPIREVYRINTAGGSPPASCDGQPGAFQIDYAAEYWFWAVPAS